MISLRSFCIYVVLVILTWPAQSLLYTKHKHLSSIYITKSPPNVRQIRLLSHSDNQQTVPISAYEHGKKSEAFENNPDNQTTENKPNLFQGIVNLLSGKGWQGKTKLSRESLAKIGLNALLAYGFVSNISYMTCVIIAWVIHGRRTGVSPLTRGQWKQFLLVYSGLWAANNIIRPLRFSLSLVLTPGFEKVVASFQKKLNLQRKGAILLTVFLFNVIGTISYLTVGLSVATSLAKVPVIPTF